MGCSCKDYRERIEEGIITIEELREFFIKRMTIDSETTDRRRKDYNQAIFHFWDDEPEKGSYMVWTETTLEMVMQCFDNAVKDWRKSWCDVEGCKRKP